MFTTLDEQIRIDELKATTTRERTIRWAVIALLSVTLFSALYFGLQLMRGS
jgi:hypothetical protein